MRDFDLVASLLVGNSQFLDKPAPPEPKAFGIGGRPGTSAQVAENATPSQRGWGAGERERDAGAGAGSGGGEWVDEEEELKRQLRELREERMEREKKSWERLLKLYLLGAIKNGSKNMNTCKRQKMIRGRPCYSRNKSHKCMLSFQSQGIMPKYSAEQCLGILWKTNRLALVVHIFISRGIWPNARITLSLNISRNLFVEEKPWLPTFVAFPLTKKYRDIRNQGDLYFHSITTNSFHSIYA